MEKWFVLAPEMLLDLHPGLSYLREVSIVRLDTSKANTVITRYSEVLNLHYIVNVGEKGLKIFTVS